MKSVVVALALIAALSCRCPTQAPEPQNALLRSALDSPPKPHPRLFFATNTEATIRRRVAAHPTLSRTLDHILASADAIENAAPIERKKIGRRLLGVSRTCLKRVVYLAFAFRMTGEQRYLQRAEREMSAAAAFADWNPSHFLDVAEMTAALAIGYDWLHADLDEDARRRIERAIIDKGLKTSLQGGWWVKTTNNWNQVCHGGLTLGALAVLEHEPKLAEQILTRARDNLPRAMAEYEPDGAYPEGPGYWVYGTTYNVLLIDALESALGDDFGLADAESLLASADYMLHVTGPTDLFFNYSDGGAKHRAAPAMRWFAKRRNEPSVLWNETVALASLLAKDQPSTGYANRFLPFLLLWATDEPRIPPTELHWRARGKTPIAMHRSSWQPDATFVAIKGGTPSANHGHMDIGSFVLDADGVRWVHDLGSQNYHSLESKGIRLWDRAQTSQRWTVFRLNNRSHNTLVVDGKLQRVRGSGAITQFAASGSMPHSIVDLAAAYKGQLRTPRRGIGLRTDRSVVVHDEFETTDRETTSVRWGIVTKAKVTLDGATATLEQGGRRMTLRVLTPADASLRLYETARPPAEHDATNKGTRMVGFEIRLPPRTRQQLTVAFAPDGVPMPQRTELPARLDDW